jgi:hypothetical protein
MTSSLVESVINVPRLLSSNFRRTGRALLSFFTLFSTVYIHLYKSHPSRFHGSVLRYYCLLLLLTSPRSVQCNLPTYLAVQTQPCMFVKSRNMMAPQRYPEGRILWNHLIRLVKYTRLLRYSVQQYINFILPFLNFRFTLISFLTAYHFTI